MTLSSKNSLIGGVLICLFGAVFFSTKAIFVKLAYRETDVDAVTLLALRMLFSLPFFVASAIATSSRAGNVKFTAGQWLYIALIGCLGYYVSSLLDFVGLQYVSAGIERLILFIYPTLVLVISALIFRDRITGKQWLAVGITYVGLLLAFFSELGFQGERDGDFYLGSLMIFACAITYAMYIVGSGKLIPLVGAAKFNSYAMTFAAVAVVIHFALVSDGSLMNLEPGVYIYSVLMAVFSTVIPSFLVTEGIKRIGSENAAIVGSIGPVSTILQAAIFLGEPIFFLQLLGTGLVLAGVLLIGKKKR